MLLKRLSIQLTMIISTMFLFLNCFSVGAAEYKPLELDLPASCYHEEGTVSYTIQKGDTLFSIGRQFNIDADLIAALNDINNPHLIMPGQKILVPKIFEVTHQVLPGDTVWDIAKIYGILPQQILLANDIWIPEVLTEGTVLSIPGIKAQVTITTNKSNNISSRNSGYRMFLPSSGVLTSLFGPRHKEFHTGIDLADKTGTPIYAAQAGKVIYVGWKGNYGKTVIIDHLNGFKTLYGHNSKIFVKVGQKVRSRDIIALMGNTGRSTGPHLHFEIHKKGKIVNPLNYLGR